MSPADVEVMTFNEQSHPRTPAGSPDGGKFAAKPGGSEADPLVSLPPSINDTDTAEQKSGLANTLVTLGRNAAALVESTVKDMLPSITQGTRVSCKTSLTIPGDGQGNSVIGMEYDLKFDDGVPEEHRVLVAHVVKELVGRMPTTLSDPK